MESFPIRVEQSLIQEELFLIQEVSSPIQEVSSPTQAVSSQFLVEWFLYRVALFRFQEA